MAQQNAGAGMPYIGSLISLISKTGVRYEGTLYTIDMVESTIALQNVRSFGTEGRKQDGPQIPASEQPFEFIIFRGTDIADLTVITNGPPAGQPAPSAPPAPYQNLQAPQSNAAATQFGTSTEVPHHSLQAGQSQGAPQSTPPSSAQQPPPAQPRQPQQQQYHTPQPPQPTPAPTVSLTSQGSGQVRGQPRNNQGGQGPSAPQQAPESSPAPQSASNSATQAAQAAAAAAIAKPARPSSFLQAAGGSAPVAPSDGSRGPPGGRGGPPGAGGGRGRGRAPPRAPPVTVPNEDFDFEEMMKKFNKQAAVKEAESKPEQPRPAEKPTFEDDFFDSISSDATERLAREDGRGRFAEQRKIDMETFGGAGMARRHQGGRGGYRGGRGPQQGQGYQNGPARGTGHGQGQGYQNGPARGQGQSYQNGSVRGRGQGYQNGPGRGEGSQGGRGGGGFQTVPSRGGYRGGGRGGNAPRGRGRGRNPNSAAPVAAQG